MSEWRSEPLHLTLDELDAQRAAVVTRLRSSTVAVRRSHAEIVLDALRLYEGPRNAIVKDLRAQARCAGWRPSNAQARYILAIVAGSALRRADQKPVRALDGYSDPDGVGTGRFR